MVEIEQKIETVVLERLRFCVSASVSRRFLEDLEVDTGFAYLTDTLVAAVKMAIFGRNIQDTVIETFEYPASWWQVFKQQYFPVFLKKKFPIRMISKNVVMQHYHVCPHLNIEPQKKHVKFVSAVKCKE